MYVEKMRQMRELQREEAVKRMTALKITPNVIKEFILYDKINVSEEYGFLYWASDNEMEMVRNFEDEYKCVVYHIIRNKTQIGEMLTFLYVSQYKEEWDDDMLDIMDGIPCVYVKNLDDDICSEFGHVAVKPSFGGLIRTV